MYPYSLWSILVLIADIWAIVNILQGGADTEKKVLWTVVVILLPVLGFVLWFFMGRERGDLTAGLMLPGSRVSPSAPAGGRRSLLLRSRS
jgi:hypothetical protein